MEPLMFVALPVGLGLLGFVEPCSLGSSFLFIRFLEGKPAGEKLLQVTSFMIARMLLIGALGAAAALVGQTFIGFQKAMWVVLGTAYAVIGILYLSGRLGPLLRAFGPGFARAEGSRGAVTLGLIFGLNIPACAAPLIFALLGVAAAGGASGAAVLEGFVSLSLFGLALSLPLAVAVVWRPLREVLDRIAAFSRRVPVIAGLVLVALGLWSIWLAFYLDLEKWA